MAKKRRVNRQQAKRMVPAARQFNKMAKLLLAALQEKLEATEKENEKISVMVGSVALPQAHHSINIQTLDMNQTKVKKKGSLAYNQRMDWEDDLRSRNKGVML